MSGLYISCRAPVTGRIKSTFSRDGEGNVICAGVAWERAVSVPSLNCSKDLNNPKLSSSRKSVHPGLQKDSAVLNAGWLCWLMTEAISSEGLLPKPQREKNRNKI